MRDETPVEIRAIVPAWVAQQIELRRAREDKKSLRRVDFAEVAGKALTAKIAQCVEA